MKTTELREMAEALYEAYLPLRTAQSKRYTEVFLAVVSYTRQLQNWNVNECGHIDAFRIAAQACGFCPNYGDTIRRTVVKDWYGHEALCPRSHEVITWEELPKDDRDLDFTKDNGSGELH